LRARAKTQRGGRSPLAEP